MVTKIKRPVVLMVLDGFGLSLEDVGNPIKKARTPNFDSISKFYPGTVLQASGMEVGLRWGDMGNSEVGHGNIGAGQVVYQNLTRIDMAIEDGSFFENPVWDDLGEKVNGTNSNVHLMGLVSNGGIHSHIDHLVMTIEAIGKKCDKTIFLHFFTDGQDTAPQSAIRFKDLLYSRLKNPEKVVIVGVCGRYYAMDKNENWDRTKLAYDSLTIGSSRNFLNFEEAILDSYQKNEFDEVVKPANIVGADGKPFGLVENGDVVVFFNFRADRARQLTQAFVFEKFRYFDRQKKLENLMFVSMVSYGAEYEIKSVFPIQHVSEPISAVVAGNGLSQLHVAETEKYAHVTYFFNGGVEEPFSGEDRILVESPKIASYDLKPEMSAYEITKKVSGAIALAHYDFILVNFANGDMVGHTGNFEAGVKAVEALDDCLGVVVKEALSNNYYVVITADHGNVEEMLNIETKTMDKEHSTNPVPIWVVGPDNKRDVPFESLTDLTARGVLADVAPTVLDIMGLKKPEHMTGMTLVGLMDGCVLPK